MDPEIRDPGAHHSPSRGPTEPGGPGPDKQPTRVSRHTPKHPAPDTENHQYTGRECGGEEIGPAFDGCPKLILEREHPKTQPDTKTGTHSHNHIFTPSCVHIKNTHTHTANIKTHNNGRGTPTHTPHTYLILPGPDTDTPEGQPAPGPRRWFPSF
ncbi:hypothetical protein ILYODFUR_030669 [Ilyodon furcidens]|uniref:Uncharacterized protein n=1 Tax=Ilyodon furcidens TaxID=33524 RepID=A0ABV0T1R3_9TELE